MHVEAEHSDPLLGEGRVLLVASDPETREPLRRLLESLGLGPELAADSAAAMARLERGRVRGLLVAPTGAEAEGLDLLERVRQRWPEVPRVLCAAERDTAVIARAVNRAGIAYFLPRPWPEAACQELVHLLRPNASRPEPVEGPAPRRHGRFPEIIGGSLEMRELLDLVAKVAETDSTALVTGETGTGKELVGRAIHGGSRRRDRIFCAVNSAAFPETLLESELFGHRRGAFTGAAQNKKGLFEHAHRGTVFLDEVAEMPLSMQAKLLRFLQTGEIRPVGDEIVRRVDVRLVTATNKDLETEVTEGRFREDLYYRLAVIPIHVPALRERREDIPELCAHFLGAMGGGVGKRIEGIDSEAMALLLGHSWPGNVRELENVIERGVALCRGNFITATDLPRRFKDGPAIVAQEPVQSLPSLEKRHILETLDRVGWNRKRAAALLQISTTTLWRRLKEFGVDREAARERAANSRLHASG